ncbi:MAG: hypothetical protein JNM25_16035 [Planctomycetes bacterium]|nr:hypothetical protein [Planctomycetota bacterium]
MSHTHLGAALLAALTLAPLATTQHNPPPWWRVNDDVTVSLAWDFDNAGAFLQPTLQVVPSWYSPAVTSFTLSPNVAWIPTLAGHNGVLGLVGTGTPTSANFDLKVDNDPHIDWIKIFWFQFDQFEGTSGEVVERIAQDLAKYGRASVEQYSEPLGGGWNRVTITARLIPQPDDEKLTWNLIENAFGSVAIDNLYVNSKCVKPGDEKGKALGDIVLPDKPLGITTNNETRAAAVTEGPGPAFLRTIWVSSRSTAGAHQVYRLDQNATAVIGASIPLPDTLVTAPLGGQDMAVETVEVVPGTFQQYVYVLVDRRPVGGVILRAINDTGVLEPTRDLLLTGFPPTPSTEFGLAFDPSGNLGAGTFWVSDPAGLAYEFSRTTPTPGALLETHAIPTGVTGLGYDATFGHFLGFSRTPRPTPGFGPSQINGYEWSAHDFLPTGVEFCGDLRIPNGAGPAGGLASGFDVYRTRATGELRMVAVARLPGTAPASSVVYELAGPFRFGWSQMGQCGMAGGPAFEGSPTWQVTLRGVPDALAAALYVGLSNDTYLGTPLPAPLAPFGMLESYASISLDASTGGLAPSGPGEFSVAIGLPPLGGLSYVPLFFQWVLFDPTVPGSLATSQAGKTIAY